jgi:hypothetical protein
VYAGSFCRCNDGFGRGVGFETGNVLCHGSRKQLDILRQIADVTTERFR